MEKEVYEDLMDRYNMIKTLAAGVKDHPEAFDTDEEIIQLDYDARLVTIYYGDPDEEEEKRLLVVRLLVKDGVETVNTFIGDKKFYMNDMAVEEQLWKTAETLSMMTESFLTDFPDTKLRWDWLGD